MTPADTPAARPPHLALRIVLVVFCFTEFIGAIFDLPTLQSGAPSPTPSMRLVDLAIATRVVLAPLLVVAAFAFTLADNLPRAVAAFALLVLAKAAASLAWMATGLLGVPSGLDGVHWTLTRYVYPAMALAALVLLRRGARLNAAGALVLAPTAIAWAYGIVVTILVLSDPD